MNQRERDALDRHITGNYGEDQLREQMCIWDDCDQDAIYCEGHAREYMAPDIDALKAMNGRLVEALSVIAGEPRQDDTYVGMDSKQIARAALAKVSK